MQLHPSFWGMRLLRDPWCLILAYVCLQPAFGFNAKLLELRMSNNFYSFTLARRALAFAVLAALSANASAQDLPGNTLHFEGRSSNWFDANNWREGRVPGANDDVVLDRGDTVIIDPQRGASPVEIRDLIVGDGAELTTLPGTIMLLRDEHIGAARVSYRSSGVIGEGQYGIPPPQGTSCVECGALLSNATPKSKRTVLLLSSVTSEVGIGGLAPASIARAANGTIRLFAGPGHYATTSAQTLNIDGHLWLNLYYGFRPVPGDSFLLFSAERYASGRFIGLPESALVGCTSAGVGLRISYVGGDGNDVVLTAVRASRLACAAPSVQLIGPELPPGTDAAREHILLARQIGVPL
jgi:hypothetical protein